MANNLSKQVTPVLGKTRTVRMPRWVRELSEGTIFQKLAIILLSIIILMGIFAPLVTPARYDSTQFVAQSYSFPSWHHLFGIDAVGRDFFSRNIYAIRISLTIGVVTAIIGGLIGIPLGLLSGYLGGWVDWVVLRAIEIVSVVPPLLVAILLASLVVSNLWTISLVIGLVSWVPIARLVRSKVLSVRESPFVEAARLSGAKSRYIMFKCLLPNSYGTVIVALVLTIPSAIVTEASLSFLGLGISPPLPDWGQMIANSLQDIYYYWYLGFFPALMLCITVVCISVAGDWLRDVLDPTTSR